MTSAIGKLEGKFFIVLENNNSFMNLFPFDYNITNISKSETGDYL